MSRTEKLLKTMLGEQVDLEPPQSRVEKILYKILGYDVELEPPQSRVEELLTELAENPPGPEPGGDTLGEFLGGTLKEYTNSDLTRVRAYQLAGYSSVGANYRLALSLPNVTTVDQYGFFNSAIKSCDMPSVTSLGEYAFASNFLTEVDFPELARLSNNVFTDNSLLTKVNLPKLEYWGTYSFSRCSALENVNLPLMTELDGYGQFSNCTALKAVPNAEHVTLIGNTCFQRCSGLTEAKLPKTHTLQSGAFSNCTNLQRVLINNNASKIGKIDAQAFNSCGQLDTLVIPNATAITPLSNSNAFSGTKIQDGSGYIYVPAALIDTYKTATNWLVFADQFRTIEDYPDIINW